jgi:hypothetical protein
MTKKDKKNLPNQPVKIEVINLNDLNKKLWFEKATIFIAVLSLIISLTALWKNAVFNRTSINISKAAVEEAAESNLKANKIAGETSQNTILHNKMSVKPILTFTDSLSKNLPDYPFIGIAIENRGIGPALVAPITLVYDNQIVGSLTRDNFKIIRDKLMPPNGINAQFINNAFCIKPGEQILVFGTYDVHSEPLRKYMLNIMEHIGFVVFYSSIYQERPNSVGWSGNPLRQAGGLGVMGDLENYCPDKIEFNQSFFKPAKK